MIRQAAIALMLCATPAAADVISECREYGEASSLLMKARQAGFTLARVYEMMPDRPPLVQAAVDDAWAEPVYDDSEGKEDAVYYFGRKHEELCLRARMVEKR